MKQHPTIITALLVAALLAACSARSSNRAVCKNDAECVAICEDFGHPPEDALCTAKGYCVCRDPADVDEDLGDTSDTGDGMTDLDGGDDLLDLVDEDTEADSTSDTVNDLVGDADATDVSDQDMGTGRCPADMVDLGSVCMDRYEAPNVANALPLVMYDFNEAAAWCQDRGKRLCYDDEWLSACEGQAATAYPYGDEYEAGRCNDEEIWRVYSQTKLNGWPVGVATPDVSTLEALLNAARDTGNTGLIAADHVAELYQGEGSGVNTGCTNETGVYDLVGNVEEWTRRRDGGDGAQFLGNLKGRYWAESRTCQSNVTTHANGFRFYEIGFRCCMAPEE